MRRVTRPAIISATALLLVLCATLASAQNVLVNGRFDGSTEPFYIDLDPAPYDAATDLKGPAGSGSLQLVDSTGYVPGLAVATACFAGPFDAGDYYYEFSTRFAPGETGDGYSSLQFFAYGSNIACIGGASFIGAAEYVDVADGRGVWVRTRLGDITQGAITLPAGTKSVGARITLNRTSQNGVLTANFDNLFLAPVGKPLCGGLVPTIGGSDVADIIYGTAAADVIVAFDGDDKVYAGGGKDFVCGGDGKDILYGEGNDDALFGQRGNDILYGGKGGDVLKGGRGNDGLVGEGGTDLCLGGPGAGDASGGCEKVKSVP